MKKNGLPLKEDNVIGWKPYDIFKDSIRYPKSLSCHVSVLSPGKTPHKPQEHMEEKFLVVISSESGLKL